MPARLARPKILERPGFEIEKMPGYHVLSGGLSTRPKDFSSAGAGSLAPNP